MSGPRSQRLRLPVRLVNGQWEFYLGGAVPVAEGSMADLTIDSSQISDPVFLRRITEEVVVPVLPAGTTLMVALNVQGTGGVWKSGEALNVPHEFLPSASPTFVPVILGSSQKINSLPPENATEDGLKLRIVGLQVTELSSGPVMLPAAISPEPAQSLNHAFTRLSEALETHRISHTGNVYVRVFYKESNNVWYPLEVLRNRGLQDVEGRLMASAWKKIEQKRGWSPVLPNQRNGLKRRK